MHHLFGSAPQNATAPHGRDMSLLRSLNMTWPYSSRRMRRTLQGKGSAFATKAVDTQGKGSVLAHEGSGNTRQRRWLTTVQPGRGQRAESGGVGRVGAADAGGVLLEEVLLIDRSTARKGGALGEKGGDKTREKAGVAPGRPPASGSGAGRPLRRRPGRAGPTRAVDGRWTGGGRAVKGE